jgi:hypothetical protein
MPCLITQQANGIAHLLSEVTTADSDRLFGEMATMQLCKVPTITFVDYVKRLLEYMACSPECFVLAVEFALRLQRKVPLTVLTVYRVYGVCTVLAAKCHDDRYYQMSYYAKVLGVPQQELCAMERYALRCLDYRMYVAPALYVRLVDELAALEPRAGGSVWRECFVRHPSAPAAVGASALPKNVQ